MKRTLPANIEHVIIRAYDSENRISMKPICSNFHSDSSMKSRSVFSRATDGKLYTVDGFLFVDSCVYIEREREKLKMKHTR